MCARIVLFVLMKAVVMSTACKMMVTVLPTGLVDRRNAAAALGRRPKTLANWIAKKVGPPCFRAGGRCYYKWSDVQEFGRGGEPCAPEFEPSRAQLDFAPSPRRRDFGIRLELDARPRRRVRPC